VLDKLGKNFVHSIAIDSSSRHSCLLWGINLSAFDSTVDLFCAPGCSRLQQFARGAQDPVTDSDSSPICFSHDTGSNWRIYGSAAIECI
jgi:hypothetical protein